MTNSNPPKIDPTVMKDQAPGRKKAAGGFSGILAKLGLGGGAATSAGGGGIAIGGAQAAAGGGLLAGIASNAGIVGVTLIASVIGVGAAALSVGHAPKAMQGSQFFAKLGVDSASHAERVARDARDQAMQSSGVDSDGVSSSLQHLVNANTGTMGQLEGGVGGEGGEAVDGAASASGEAPENTVQAPNNDWGAASAKAAAGAGVDGRRKLKKSTFKKSGSSASTKLAMGGAAGTARGVSGASGSKLSNFSSGPSAASRSRSAVRTRKSVSAGHGGGASAQLKAHSSAVKRNLGSGRTSSAGSGTVMDGGQSRIGSTGAGASNITGAGGGGSSGNSSPIVNPVTSQNTSTKNPPPPIKKGKDKTPYRKEIQQATIALMAATALILMASMIAKQRNPQSLKISRILAGLAFVAASIAAFMGVMLMVEHKQTMQGGMFAAMGGIIMLQAGTVILQPELTDEEIAAAEAKKAAQVAEMKAAAGGGGVTEAPILDAGTTVETNPGATHIDTSNMA